MCLQNSKKFVSFLPGCFKMAAPMNMESVNNQISRIRPYVKLQVQEEKRRREDRKEYATPPSLLFLSAMNIVEQCYQVSFADEVQNAVERYERNGRRRYKMFPPSEEDVSSLMAWYLTMFGNVTHPYVLKWSGAAPHIVADICVMRRKEFGAESLSSEESEVRIL